MTHRRLCDQNATNKRRSSCGTKMGLTTYEALRRLHQAVQKELQLYEDELCKAERFPFRRDSWFYDAFHHSSAYSAFRWPSFVVLIIIVILLFVCYVQKNDIRYHQLPYDAAVILVLVVVNVYVVGFDNRLRHGEVLHKAKGMLQYLERCVNSCQWKPSNYPQLNAPTSPCIALQWTMRNGELAHIHLSLLVEGDVVVLRPGQVVPVNCRSLDGNSELKAGDVYAAQETTTESFTSPRIRSPQCNGNYILLDTPYVDNLRLALRMSQNRPLTFFEKDRHIISVVYFEQIFLPILLTLMFSINALRYVYLYQYVGHWTEMFIILQVEAFIPLLPLAFPVCWIVLNAYGMARLVALFKISKQRRASDMPMDEFGEVPACTDTSTHFNWSDVRKHFCNILLGRDETLYRTANLLHVLGSVTSLCCVDKKGILSWPNPTPEKVFFLNSGDLNCSESDDGVCVSTRDTSQNNLLLHGHPSLYDDLDAGGELATDDDRNAFSSNNGDHFNQPHSISQQGQHRSGDIYYDHGYEDSRVEVLDLTHNNLVPFLVQFDDPNWKRHISSLKPLGLTILLNTCNPRTHDHYAQFSSHIACEALNNDVVVPVINRRCLCELARQIGFTEQALDVFQLKRLLASFRHVQADQARRDKLARSLPNSKLRFPFPHMVSVVVKELNTGMLQLMSQGTGDIILDSCSDFWDGRDLAPLNEIDRKKILDFYHRTSLTSYCTAFAYRPLSADVSGKLSDVYLEIPSNSGWLYSSLWSPSPPKCWDSQPDTRVKVMNRCLSSDSLLGHGQQDADLVETADTCFEIQCNQVFIAMVAMQYQARLDMVHLIEQLDKACIRFVHFSKENELRSRVFSEKMGLESGWNCHISLLSQKTKSESGNSVKASKLSLNRNQTSTDEILNVNDGGPRSPKGLGTLEAMRPLSFSAPSAINLEVATVKFGDEISMHDLTAATETSSQLSNDERSARSRESNRVSHASMISNSNVKEDVMEDLTEALISGRSVDGSRYEMTTGNGCHPSRSPSHITESTEQSVPITFDMSNRAKLPKGIKNIRPHLESIDNVPLLVSLFTDCTPDATCEMIKIMQEYGEVVCCIGSSATCFNIPIFMQADASIALEPLYPQLCVLQSACDIMSPNNCALPMDISYQLNSLPCSLTFSRDDQISIYQLIMEARHFTMALRNCFHFLLASSLSLSALILLSSLLLLPPPLSLAHVLFFVLFSLPLLSLSLIGCPTDPQIMVLATGKNSNVITRQALLGFIGYNGARFLPSVAICVLCFTLVLSTFCDVIPSDTVCVPLVGNTNHTEHNEWNGWSNEYAYSLGVAQNLVALLFIVYLVIISASFVHQSHLFWRQSPFANRLWCIIVIFIVLLQGVLFTFDLHIQWHPGSDDVPGLKSVPIEVWIVCSVWPAGVFAANELMKMHKIKVDVRNQKKARLEFGTKLGMNSPF